MQRSWGQVVKSPHPTLTSSKPSVYNPCRTQRACALSVHVDSTEYPSAGLRGRGGDLCLSCGVLQPLHFVGRRMVSRCKSDKLSVNIGPSCVLPSLRQSSRVNLFRIVLANLHWVQAKPRACVRRQLMLLFEDPSGGHLGPSSRVTVKLFASLAPEHWQPGEGVAVSGEMELQNAPQDAPWRSHGKRLPPRAQVVAHSYRPRFVSVCPVNT